MIPCARYVPNSVPVGAGWDRSLTHPEAFTEAVLSGTDRLGPVGAQWPEPALHAGSHWFESGIAHQLTLSTVISYANHCSSHY